MNKLTSIKIINTASGLCSEDEATKHITAVFRTGKIKHQIYNRIEKTPLYVNVYKAEKQRCEDLFVFLEKVVEEWENNYSVEVCDGYYWDCYLRYSDRSVRVIKGTVQPPPDGEEIERKIIKLVEFDEEPWIF